MNDRPPTLAYQPARHQQPLRGVIPGLLLVLVLTLWTTADPARDLLTPRHYGAAFGVSALLPLTFLIAAAFGAGMGFWRRKFYGFGLGLILGGFVALLVYFFLLASAT